MAIAPTVEQHLIKNRCAYAIHNHCHEPYNPESPHPGVPAGHLARAVILRDRLGYLMAVVPADSGLELDLLREWLERDLTLAPEEAVAALFPDCADGAVPAVGAAYGLETWFDERLTEVPDIYFEAGDRQSLVHVATEQYLTLLAPARHARLT